MMTNESISTYILTIEDKEKSFGIGEWLDEPDQVTFTHCGLRCMINRVAVNDGKGLFGGHFCGYVTLPDSVTASQDQIDELEVHGSVTFSDTHDDLKEFAIGFDCAHAWDIVPSMEKFMEENIRMKEIKKMSFAGMTTYKNIEFAIQETKKLAEQIKEWE